MKYIVVVLVSLLAFHARAAEIAPFTSDGCSSFPDGTPENQNLWIHCCIRHDLAYWMGGTREERLSADLALEQCVANAGEPDIAKLMLQGVRAGGNPLLPTPFRWGYGWPFPRDYKPLTEAEKEQVRKELESLSRLVHTAAEELTARP